MIRRSPFILVATLCCLLTLATSASAEEEFSALVTGNRYQSLNEMERTLYIIGAVEGILYEATHLKFQPDIVVLGQCVAGKTPHQLMAITDKYTAAHPELWHRPMSGLVYRAVIGGCEEDLLGPKAK